MLTLLRRLFAGTGDDPGLRRRAWLNLSLLVAVGGLLTVTLLKPGQETPPLPERLSTIDTSAVQQIRIAPADGEAITLARSPDAGWQLQAPVQAEAQPFRVDSLLALATAEIRHEVGAAAELDLAGYGLQPARGLITFDDLDIHFGDSNPVGLQRYVQVGERVLLIDDRHFHHLRSEWTHWVETALLPEADALLAVELPQQRIVREGDAAASAAWTLDPPQPQLGSDAIARWAQKWLYARALEVSAGAEASDATLAGPSPIQVRYRRGEQTVQREFTLLARPEQDETLLVEANSGLAYHLPAAQAAALTALPEPEPEPGPVPKPEPAPFDNDGAGEGAPPQGTPAAGTADGATPAG